MILAMKSKKEGFVEGATIKTDDADDGGVNEDGEEDDDDDEMEEKARPAIPELKKALTGQPNKYIVRVANRALNDLLGTNNQVR